MHEIRVKHRGEGGRKKILAEDVVRFFFETPWVRLGQQRIKDGRAEAATGNSADGKKMRRKVRIRILNAAENGGSPVSRPNSTAFGGDDKERVQRPSPIVLFREIIPRSKRLDNIGARYFLRRNSPNNMVIVPKTEKKGQ